jgi:hypothetical protein
LELCWWCLKFRWGDFQHFQKQLAYLIFLKLFQLAHLSAR